MPAGSEFMQLQSVIYASVQPDSCCQPHIRRCVAAIGTSLRGTVMCGTRSRLKYFTKHNFISIAMVEASEFAVIGNGRKKL